MANYVYFHCYGSLCDLSEFENGDFGIDGVSKTLLMLR